MEKEKKRKIALRKANFHSVDICRLMKNQSCKKRSRSKTDSNYNVLCSKLPNCS